MTESDLDNPSDLNWPHGPHPVKQFLTTLALAAAALAVSPLAQAGSSASASIGQIEIFLTDLNLSDGLDPSITFGDFAVPITFVLSAGSLSSQSVGNLSGLLVAGSSNTSVDFGGVWSEAGVLPFDPTSWTLGAYTSVEFRTVASVEGITNTLDNGFALANASLVLSSGNAADQTRGLSGSASSGGPTSFQQTESFSLTAFNNSAQTLDGSIAASLDVSGDTAVPEIPEPSTYAMMLLGLGTLGWIRRRRSDARP